MQLTMPAAALVVTGACSAPCLLAVDHDCDCRCSGRYHGLLAAVQVNVDPLRAPSVVNDAVSQLNRRAKRGRHFYPDSVAELQAAALEIHRASLARTNQPAGLRQLQRELGIGQARATELRDWLAAQREQFATVEHANGHAG